MAQALVTAASNLMSENLKQAKAAIRQEKTEDFFRSILPAAGVLTTAFFVLSPHNVHVAFREAVKSQTVTGLQRLRENGERYE